MLSQRQVLKLQQKLSPQQIQLMKMLQVPVMELEQRIKEELEVNPALEEGMDENPIDDSNLNEEAPEEFASQDDLGDHEDQEREDFDMDPYLDDDEIPDYKLYANNTSPDEERKEIPYAGGTGFQEYLNAQIGLRNLSEKENEIALTIIGNIDDDGYMRRELYALADDLAFSQNIDCTEKEIEKVLKEVQELDPPGVGARNLQECLVIQLKRKPLKKTVRHALEILEEEFDEFSKRHFDKIGKKLELSDEELKAAVNEILHLNPKPGGSVSEVSKSVQDIIPDFYLTETDGELELSMNSRNAPELRVSKAYVEMLREYGKNRKLNDKQKKEAVAFVKQKIDGAKWFIDAIKQRENTLMGTMQAIINYQWEYFQEGDETKMKPMILKDIADLVGLDISTISRVANSKYVQTHFGTYPLKYFFSESLSTDSGEEVSSREVKKILEDSINAEDKHNPLADDKLCLILQAKGYNIARRTVAKYREQLGIPVARLRKEL
jgi:RNA polymerase sigma-54 factor